MGKNAHASASRSALCSWADARCAGMVSVQAGLVCVPVAVPVCWQDCCCIWVGGRERCSFSLISAFFLFVMFSLCVREAASLLCLFMWLWLCAIMRAANSMAALRAFLHAGDIVPCALEELTAHRGRASHWRTVHKLLQCDVTQKRNQALQTPKELLCWGRSYRGQSYRRNSCLVPRHMTECRAQKKTTTRRRSPWDKRNQDPFLRWPLLARSSPGCLLPSDMELVSRCEAVPLSTRPPGSCIAIVYLAFRGWDRDLKPLSAKRAYVATLWIAR
jgi:hypothetical protein